MLSDDAKAILVLTSRLGDRSRPSLSPKAWHRLAQELEDAGLAPARVFDSDFDASRFARLDARQVQRLTGDSVAVFVELDVLISKGIWVLTMADDRYPGRLRVLGDAAPPHLFGVGEVGLLGGSGLAVVGSRNPSRGGSDNARAFSDYLARAGLLVTSGLALGIDACAHEAALAAGGETIAIAATGLDRVYPAAHRDLAHRIVAQGALVSEFALGTPPRRENFPRRNRLISGLSLGVLVVEAALKSGSLITARLAAEQGREVFAIPGSIHSPLARGCHALIRQGAKLVETAPDILEELGALARFVAAPPGSNATVPGTPPDPAQQELLELMGYDPVEVDMLIERSGLTPGSVSSMLLHMELCGLIEARPGGRVQRTS